MLLLAAVLPGQCCQQSSPGAALRGTKRAGVQVTSASALLGTPEASPHSIGSSPGGYSEGVRQGRSGRCLKQCLVMSKLSGADSGLT